MDDYNQKIKEYKEYVDNHIANVRKAFNFYGEKVCDRLHLDIERLADMVDDILNTDKLIFDNYFKDKSVDFKRKVNLKEV